jgi:quercetin dioxygenase-like cupin family protein
MRLALIATLGLWLTTAGGVAAQATNPGVTTQIAAQGDLDYSDSVGGPATVYIGTIDMEPGTSYAGWHTHPGPIWVVVTNGELALYGPDGCRTSYAPGTAYLGEPQTLYELRNETDQPLQLSFAGVIPTGQRPTIPARAPSASCAHPG